MKLSILLACLAAVANAAPTPNNGKQTLRLCIVRDLVQ